MLRLARILILVAVGFTAAAQTAQGPLVSARSVWKYNDYGIDLGTAWREPAFDDRLWPSGPAELGYGDGDEATVVGFGPNPQRRYITTYFRQTFQVADRDAVTSLRLRMIRDDGIVVYINGLEAARSNMPAGPISFRTLAVNTIGDVFERTWVDSEVSPSLLVTGTNVIAVEVHQASETSSDLSFALELLANDTPPTPGRTRGPYLQQATPTSIVVRWRTDTPTDSLVRYGTSLHDLSTVAYDPTPTIEHEVKLTGLTPSTRYFYAVETSLSRVAGGDAHHTFVTSPPAGTVAPTRVWVLGDSGTGGGGAIPVRDAYYARGGIETTDLVLMLGDNAYDFGLDHEYQRALFDFYPELLRRTVFWATIGNHETAQLTNPALTIPYFVNFNLPTNGEAGGIPSGTEKYYSFDHGNIHFISLDSMTSDRSPTGPMLTWLRDDLASTRQPWIIAFWHHPPYSKGSHDSDRETELVEMRENAVPILEQGGADLILTGHSHSYERSYFINGHYGHSSTFVSSMKVDAGDGRVTGTGAYQKGTTATPSYVGTVYAVSGSAAITSGGPLNHPAKLISLNQLGSMILDIRGLMLDATFLRGDGTVGDTFRIDKREWAQTAPAAPQNATATPLSSTTISLTWSDVSWDATSFRIERCLGAKCTSFRPVASTTTTTFVDDNLTPATVYRYRVIATNPAGLSGDSNVAEATTPPPVRGRRRGVRP